MLTSLRDKILPLADDTVVLPGHGPATTIGRERATQPVPRRGGRRAPADGAHPGPLAAPTHASAARDRKESP